ncbi:MAG: hypothetical protein L0Y74_09100 [candidate division Zixibacteria bacterium]|nr:hypothetical protein [candidate division Zixibacteria bacterium]
MDQAWYQKWVDEVQRRSKNNDPFSLKDYVTMCIDLEAHETDTHNKYAAAAEKEGKKEIAKMFNELAGGEDYFSGKFEKTLQEWR